MGPGISLRGGRQPLPLLCVLPDGVAAHSRTREHVSIRSCPEQPTYTNHVRCSSCQLSLKQDQHNKTSCDAFPVVVHPAC
jgi:hypothetical protein